ncbi:methyl-accepting chemotaxis protein [Halomonas sp. GXIMD04776]|uniref:methyl-accepting chemotaxis protein n=1 Tax=Halomonas sp. GXIMD04776 TaxID=3415605 RepID=UPI003CB61E21
MSALIQLAESGGFIAAFLGKPDGSMISSDGWEPPADYDASQRDWYLNAVEQGKTVVTMPYVDADSGQMVVTFATPVERNGTLAGVVGGDVFIDTVVADVAAIQTTPSSFAFLSTGGKTLIAHPNPDLTLKPLNTLNDQLTPSATAALSESGGWQEIVINNRIKRLAMAPIPGSEWELGVALDEQEATAALGAIIQSSLIALLVITLTASVLLGLWLKRTLGGLVHVSDALENIASGDGDLSRRLPVAGRDEVAKIADAFNRFADKINDVLLDVRESSESVRVAASEIAMGGQDLSSRTETAASNIQETSASMEQLTSTVEHTAQSSRQANQLSESASEVATRGGQVVANVVQTMDDIDASSKQIAEIVTVMDSIAFQTNLLALNASVEAARAGEQGRGFAVVASEVRQLAGRSADAAQQIKELIDNSSNKTRAGAELVRNAGATMDEIVASVARVTDVLGEISAATNEQSQGIGQVNEAVAELDRMTQENAAMVEESTTAAGQLQEQSQRLAQIVGAFTLVTRQDGKTLLTPLPAAHEAAVHPESERA